MAEKRNRRMEFLRTTPSFTVRSVPLVSDVRDLIVNSLAFDSQAGMRKDSLKIV